MESPETPTTWPRDVVGLLAALSGLLWLYQYTTLAKFSILNVDLRYSSLSDFVSVTKAVVPLDARDALWTALIVLTVLILLVLEIRSERLTAFFSWIFETERRTVLLLTLSGLVWVRFYLAPGQSSWLADTAAHTTYSWIAAQAFSNGELPIWTNYLCTGSPFLQFYGFLFFYAVGFLSILLGDLFWSIKLTMAAAHVASGLTMYLFVRSLTGSRRAAFLAGSAYVLCFWHTQQVLIMGRLPLSLFYPLLPLPFHFCERIWADRAVVASVVAGGAALAALTFTHPGYAAWAFLLLALYVTTRCLLDRRLGLAPGILMVLLGLALGASLTVPMWLEGQDTLLKHGISMSRVPDVAWQQLVSWSNYRLIPFGLPEGAYQWYGGYLGVSLIIIVLLGLVRVCRSTGMRVDPRAAGVCAGLLAAIILVFGYRLPLLRTVPLYHSFNAGRYLLFVVFFLAAAAGVAVWLLTRKTAGTWSQRRTFTALILLVSLDLGLTTFQHPYMPPSASRSVIRMPEELLNTVTDRSSAGIPDSRMLINTDVAYAGVVIGWTLTTTGIPLPYGLYNESPLVWPDFVGPLTSILNRAVSDAQTPSEVPSAQEMPNIIVGAHLLGVRHLLFAMDEGKKVGYADLDRVGPVFVSARIVPSPPRGKDAWSEGEERLQELLALMGEIDTGLRTCEQFPVDGIDFPEETGTRPEAELLAHRVENQRVDIRLDASSECFARLAYAYYPYLRVTIDGERVTARRTAGGFILIRLSKGIHDITLEPYLSPLRRGLLASNAALLVLCIGLVYRERRTRKARSRIEHPTRERSTEHGPPEHPLPAE